MFDVNSWFRHLLSFIPAALVIATLALAPSAGAATLAAAATPATSAAPAAPAQPEVLVQGGLLGVISSGIDSVQNNLELNDNLVDAWRLRADRAADEVNVLVTQPSPEDQLGVASDFCLLSVVWLGAFLLLHGLARLVLQRIAKQRWMKHRLRFQAILGYLLNYTLPALVCLPLALAVSKHLDLSVGRALALCLAYSTSSGMVSSSLLLSLAVILSFGHRREAVRVIRQTCGKPLFLIGFLAALSDALTSPQIARQLGWNITSSIAVFTGLAATLIFGVLVVRMRRPVAHLIRNRAWPVRHRQRALQESLRIFSSVWYLPILLMILVSTIHLIGAGKDSQKALQSALLTTVLLIGTVFLSTLFHHLFQLRPDPRRSVYKERFLSVLHALLRIVVVAGFLELLARIWGFSLLDFAASNTVGRAISDSLSSIGLIFLVTWLLWVVLDTAIQESLKTQVGRRGARQPSTRAKTILPLLRNAIKIILVVICAITTMANLGINVGPLLAGAGVVGLAIGFGSQQLVQDVITGLFIIIEDTISIGDWVVVDPTHSGTVESLTIRTLRLRDGKGFVHSIPFGQIKAVTNQSRQFAYAFFSVQITYDSDVDTALEMIRESGRFISEHPLLKDTLQTPLEVFGVDRMDLNGIYLTAQFRTVSGGQYAVMRAFNEKLVKLVEQTDKVRFAQTYPQFSYDPRQNGNPAMNDANLPPASQPGNTNINDPDAKPADVADHKDRNREARQDQPLTGGAEDAEGHTPAVPDKGKP